MRKTMTRTTSMPRTMIILFFVVAIIAMVDSFILNSPRNSCSDSLYSSSSYYSTTTTTSSSRQILLKSSSSLINRRTRSSSLILLPMASSSSSSSSSSSGGNDNNESGNDGNSNDNGNGNNENDMMELLNEIPFLPKEVMSKFLSSIGGPLAAANIQAGYQAGIISLEELNDIQTKLPDMVSNNDDDSDNNGIQSIDYITKKWEDALVGQPWYIQKFGSFSSKTIVQLVAKLQQKTLEQVNAMKYINDNALVLIQNDVEVLQLLSISSELESESNDDNDTNDVVKLKFNNTRAKYESDRKVWSASMDVFDERRMITSSSTDNNNSNNNDNDALAALLLAEGIDDNENEKLTGNIGITTVVDVDADNNNNNNNNEKKKQSNNSNKIGLVNAYFIPNEEIKILVVEINDSLYNITWKGLE